jgi:hypothetical protein
MKQHIDMCNKYLTRPSQWAIFRNRVDVSLITMILLTYDLLWQEFE